MNVKNNKLTHVKCKQLKSVITIVFIICLIGTSIFFCSHNIKTSQIKNTDEEISTEYESNNPETSNPDFSIDLTSITDVSDGDEKQFIFVRQNPFTYTYYEFEGNLKGTIKEANIPEKPGVYIISGIVNGIRKVFFIGKAGTMKRDGSLGRQTLSKRLTAKQKGITARKFYNKMMKEMNLKRIKFSWFVTYNKDIKILPKKAEADLLQSYFNKFNVLPTWNNI